MHGVSPYFGVSILAMTLQQPREAEKREPGNDVATEEAVLLELYKTVVHQQLKMDTTQQKQ